MKTRPTERATAKLVSRFIRAGCANRPEGNAMDFARDWVDEMLGLSDEDLDSVYRAHLDGPQAGWWPKAPDLRGYARDIVAKRARQGQRPAGCAECRGAGSLPYVAEGPDPTTGRPTRYAFEVRCRCAAGAALSSLIATVDQLGPTFRGLPCRRDAPSDRPLDPVAARRLAARMAGWGRTEIPERAAARERGLREERTREGYDSRELHFRGRGAGDDYEEDDTWRA